MRRCSDCAETLALERFGVNRRNADGLSRICKPCISAKNRKYYAKNRESLVPGQREYCRRTKDAHAVVNNHGELDPEWLERRRLRQRRYYHATYRDRKREQNLKWRQKNPAVARARMQRYRARLADNCPIPFSPNQWRDKVAYWGWKCWICRQPLGKYHQDHVKPISKGGTHCLANLRPACASCNTSKGNTWPYSPKETT